MKKRFLILILSLLLALNTAACGTQSADGSDAVPDTPDGSAADDSGFSQNTSDGSGFGQNTSDGSGLNTPAGSGLDLSGLAGIDDSSLSFSSLTDWISSSEDAALTVQSTNQSLASTGITFDLTVDGRILVYQYYLPDGYFKDGLAEEDLAAAFDSMVDAGSASVGTIVSVFMDKYGLTVDAVRFAYYSKDGTELYSRDVRP